MNQNKVLHSGAVLMAGILWGSMGIFVRSLNSAGLSAMEIVGSRAIGTALFFLIFLGIFQRKAFRIRLKDIWCFIGTGIFSILFFNFCYYQTILLADLSVAAILLYTAPSIVIVLSAILFKEKMTRWRIIALLLAFAGCVLVTGVLGGGMNISKSALIIGLGSGLGYALYTIFGRYALEKGYSSVTISFYTFLMASIGIIPFLDLKNVWNGITQVEGGILFYFAFVFFTTVLTYLFYTWGMQEIENGVAAILATIEPVVATLVGVFFFHEHLSGLELVGIVFVVLSIVLSNRE